MRWLAAQGFKDIIQRYLEVWRSAWSVRHEMAFPHRLADERAFLPAHLELQETPAHPAPMWTMRVIVSLFACALLWAILGKLDIVASANGKVVPNDRVKMVQPLEPGIVRAIRVQDGQYVAAGKILVELDTVAIDADLAKSRDALLTARLGAARAEALLQSLQAGREIALVPPADVPAVLLAREEQLAAAQLLEHRGKQAGLSAELAKRNAELATTRELVAKLEQKLPIVRSRAEEYKRLLEEKFVSRHSWLDQEKERINVERDLAAQHSRIAEYSAAVQAQERQMQNLTSEFRRQQLDLLNQARQQARQFDEDLTKASQRKKQAELTAPVSGVVQQLAIHTVGGVVTAAQPLMVIVPEDTLEIDAAVENRDIGFVKPGQIATIKVETFPYTRYGYLHGRVVALSGDAIADEKKGLIYHARIRLDSDQLLVDGKWIRLSPGMAVTAEIKTGRRRMIDYILSPLSENTSEAFRER